MSSAELIPISDDERLYGIAQVSKMTGLKPFVLRYWESEFPMLEPVKSKTGHRLYRQRDIDLVEAIKKLLYDEGFTIAGAKRHLQELALAESGAGAAEAAEVAAGANGDAPEPVAAEPAPPQQGVVKTTEAAINSETQPEAQPADDASVRVKRETLEQLREELRGFLTLLEGK